MSLTHFCWLPEGRFKLGLAVLAFWELFNHLWHTALIYFSHLCLFCAVCTKSPSAKIHGCARFYFRLCQFITVRLENDLAKKIMWKLGWQKSVWSNCVEIAWEFATSSVKDLVTSQKTREIEINNAWFCIPPSFWDIQDFWSRNITRHGPLLCN